jgi:hypothetical protein
MMVRKDVGVGAQAVLVGLDLPGLRERAAHFVKNDQVVGLERLPAHLQRVERLVLNDELVLVAGLAVVVALEAVRAAHVTQLGERGERLLHTARDEQDARAFGRTVSLRMSPRPSFSA